MKKSKKKDQKVVGVSFVFARCSIIHNRVGQQNSTLAMAANYRRN